MNYFAKSRFKRGLTSIFVFCMFMPMMPHGCSTMGAHKKHEEKSQAVGNKICPISGNKIDEKAKATYHYKGKAYNFCYVSCVEKFKKDPEKYINKIEQQLKNEQEHPSTTAPQHSH